MKGLAEAEALRVGFQSKGDKIQREREKGGGGISDGERWKDMETGERRGDESETQR